jgi:hypothetical protein
MAATRSEPEHHPVESVEVQLALSQARTFMEQRPDWYENDRGDWIYQWSFRGRRYPPNAPLTDLIVRITHGNRPGDAPWEPPGVLIEITASGVPYGCIDHTSSRCVLLFSDPTLNFILETHERGAATEDLADIAYCTMFGECADAISSPDEHMAAMSQHTAVKEHDRLIDQTNGTHPAPAPSCLSLHQWEQLAHLILSMNADGLIRLPADEVAAWRHALDTAAKERAAAATGQSGHDRNPRGG